MKAKLLSLSILFALFSLFDLSAQEKAFDPTLSAVPEDVEKWIDAELAKVKNEPIQDYESDKFFSKEPAKIIGYIKGYDPSVGFDTGIYYASNELTREEYPVTIEIQPDGRFEADIPLIHPVKSFLSFNNRMMYFYLEPGQTLAMVLDWEDFLEAEKYNRRFYPQNSIEYKGKMAQINKGLSLFQFPRFNYDEYKNNQLNLSAQDFKEYAFGFQKENQKKLDSFLEHNQVSGNTELILRNENKLQGGIMVMNYLMNRDYYKKENPENDFLKEKIEVDYYSFLRDLPLDNKSLLIIEDFSSFINRFEYAAPLLFHPKSKAFIPEVSELEYFDQKNIKLTEEERKLLTPHKFDSKEEVDQHIKDRKKFREKYASQVKEYTDKYIAPFMADFDNSTDYMAPWHKKDSVMANHLHLKNDLIYDITKTRSLNYYVNRITEAEQAYDYWDQLSATIENDFLKKEGERLIQAKFPKKKENIDGMNSPSIALKSETIPLPDGKAKDLFYDLIDEYKGKILFVDFWATSCAPCVATIKRMKETRKEFKNNPDFDFVFITDQRQSPLKGYENFTKQQELENIHRVDTDTYNRFRQLFKFNGIPKYVVLNKDGEVIDDDFKMYLFDNELPGILKKYK